MQGSHRSEGMRFTEEGQVELGHRERGKPRTFDNRRSLSSIRRSLWSLPPSALGHAPCSLFSSTSHLDYHLPPTPSSIHFSPYLLRIVCSTALVCLTYRGGLYQKPPSLGRTDFYWLALARARPDDSKETDSLRYTKCN